MSLAVFLVRNTTLFVAREVEKSIALVEISSNDENFVIVATQQ